MKYIEQTKNLQTVNLQPEGWAVTKWVEILLWSRDMIRDMIIASFQINVWRQIKTGSNRKQFRALAESHPPKPFYTSHTVMNVQYVASTRAQLHFASKSRRIHRLRMHSHRNQEPSWVFVLVVLPHRLPCITVAQQAISQQWLIQIPPSYQTLCFSCHPKDGHFGHLSHLGSLAHPIQLQQLPMSLAWNANKVSVVWVDLWKWQCLTHSTHSPWNGKTSDAGPNMASTAKERAASASRAVSKHPSMAPWLHCLIQSFSCCFIKILKTDQRIIKFQ